MKIKTIELYGVHLPYAQGIYTLSGGRQYEGFEASIIKIKTDCGLDGFGESTPFGSTYIAAHSKGVRAGIADIAPHLIVHLGQTIPSHLLKCILDVRDMVTVETADFEASIVDGGIKAPDLPGLGLKVKPEILGKPLANWTA